MIEVTNSRGVRAFNLDLNSTPKGISTVAGLSAMSYNDVEIALLGGRSVFDMQGNEYRDQDYDPQNLIDLDEEIQEMEGYLSDC